MISDPQSPPILAQNQNTEPFPTASYPGDAAVNQAATGGGMLQRSAPPWMQRQALPQAQPPMYRPRMQDFGGPYGPGGFAGPYGPGGGYGGPPPWMQQQQQMPQWAPPWMQGGGGYGGPPPWMQQRQQYMPQYQPQYQPQAPAAPQYRAPNGNTGFAGPMPQYNQAASAPANAPQYNRQAVTPQPAGTTNTAPPQAAPPALPNRQAAITPTPIYNRSNELA